MPSRSVPKLTIKEGNFELLPQQVLGLDLDPRSDLFTVGIILAQKRSF